MTRLTKAAYLTLVAERYPDNTSREITPADDRADKVDIAGSFLSYEDDGAILGTTIQTVAIDTLVTALMRTLLVDCTVDDVDIQLPPAADMEGQRLELIKIDATSNSMVIIPDGAELISGQATKEIENQWSGYTIQSDGTQWVVIGTV